MPASVFRPDLFRGQRVLITGGGTGIGLAVAHRFAEHGADVAVLSRKRENVEPAAAAVAKHGVKTHWVTCDVRDFAQVQAAVAEVEERLGPIDVLVNGASGNFVVPVEGMSPNAWAAVRGIVLDGTFHMSKAVGERMLQRRKGTIVNLLATYAWGAGPLLAHNAAAKAGVLSLTRSLALEWADRGVRVCGVAPGFVDTPQSRANLWPDEDLVKKMVASIPAGRFLSEEETADAVLWMASPAAAYALGEVFVIDGGQWLNNGAFRE